MERITGQVYITLPTFPAHHWGATNHSTVEEAPGKQELVSLGQKVCNEDY